MADHHAAIGVYLLELGDTLGFLVIDLTAAQGAQGAAIDVGELIDPSLRGARLLQLASRP